MKIESVILKTAGCLAFLLSSNVQAKVDYGHMYSAMLPNEQTMNVLPYAIPCVEAKNQYGATFYRGTWLPLPRNITQWDA